MSEIFNQWKSNVINHPEKMKLDFEWKDTKTGWSVWAANGYWFYDLRSPEGGKFELSLLEKWKMG
ncbi:MAG: hypothetical protein GY941_29860, partial [Planctomycetes bacterium]|nr:hypothetical protein [Planctomycetota bacterium]